MTTPAGQPPVRDTARLAFFVLGAAFFGLALLDRLLAFAAGFSSLLLTVFLTWLLVFLISPLVDSLDRRLPFGRGLAIAVAYGAVIGSIALFVAAIAQLGVREATDLVGRTNEITGSIAAQAGNLQRAIGLDRSTVDLAAIVEGAQRQALPAVTELLASQTQIIATSVVSVFGTLFLIVILSLYAVADPEAINGAVRRIVPNRHAETLTLVERTVGRAFRGFIRAQLVLVLVQVGITLVLGVVFGLPYLFLLTVSTGLLMFIPFFGPPLALVIIAITAITQTILVNAIQPRLLRTGVGLHPILVIVALLVGSQVAGLWGAIFGIPLFAVVNLLVRYAVDVRAVNEVEGIELDEAVAAIQAEHPEVEVEEAVAIAADQAEAILDAEAAEAEPPGP